MSDLPLSRGTQALRGLQARMALLWESALLVCCRTRVYRGRLLGCWPCGDADRGGRPETTPHFWKRVCDPRPLQVLPLQCKPGACPDALRSESASAGPVLPSHGGACSSPGAELSVRLSEVSHSGSQRQTSVCQLHSWTLSCCGAWCCARRHGTLSPESRHALYPPYMSPWQLRLVGSWGGPAALPGKAEGSPWTCVFSGGGLLRSELHRHVLMCWGDTAVSPGGRPQRPQSQSREATRRGGEGRPRWGEPPERPGGRQGWGLTRGRGSGSEHARQTGRVCCPRAPGQACGRPGMPACWPSDGQCRTSSQGCDVSLARSPEAAAHFLSLPLLLSWLGSVYREN